MAVAAGGGSGDYANALQRDIFDPLGLSSVFNATTENAVRVVVSSKIPFEVVRTFKLVPHPHSDGHQAHL